MPTLTAVEKNFLAFLFSSIALLAVIGYNNGYRREICDEIHERENLMDKKILRRTLATVLALVMLSPLYACGQTPTDEPTTDQPTVEQPLPEENEPTPEPEPAPVVIYDDYVRATASNVNLRSGAGTSYAVLGQAEKGTTYAVIGKQGNWYKTYYRNQVAYFYAEYGAVFSIQESKNQKIENVINEAYKLIGVPYVYGAVRLHDGKGNFLKGFTAQKFDCSSLVQYAFYNGAGKLLDVTTRTQVKQGTYVPPSELSRGDCIYFTNESRQHLTGVERVGHVAIYLGNDYILHTASDYARIEKMSATRWKFYIEARRFI